MGRGYPIRLKEIINPEMMSYMVGAPISQLYLKGRNYIVSPGWHPSNYGARIQIGG